MSERLDVTVAEKVAHSRGMRRQRTAKGSTCTNCRQLKLKCDAKTAFPQDCSRCRRAGKSCVVDRTYRRQSNKEYLQSLEKEVQALRNQSSSASPACAYSNGDGQAELFPADMSQLFVSNAVARGRWPVDSRHTTQRDVDILPPKFPLKNRAVAGQTLGEVHIPSELVSSLLEGYYADYHIFFPILPEFDDFILEYDQNQLLLWTILAVALKNRPETYSLLVDPVRMLAADLYGPQSRSLKTMQALLLLCAWPFPFQRTQNDFSAMYCSLATNIGYQLGLHRPLCKSDFEEDTRESVRATTTEMETWYGCFIVNTWCVSYFSNTTINKPLVAGSIEFINLTPLLISRRNAVLSAITGSSSNIAPFSFLLDLSLTYLAYQWVKTLGDDDTMTTGLHPRPSSLMTLFENQVTAIRLQYRATWSERHELTLCAIQLQIYSFAIQTVEGRAESPEHEFIIRYNEIRSKATTALVDLAKHLLNTVSGEICKWPIFPRLHLGRAAAIGIHIAATTSDEPTRATVLQACKDIVRILAEYIQYPREHTARITKHFAAGIRTIEGRGSEWFQTVETTDKRPPIRARMSANIPYQIVWWAKHSSRIIPEPEQVVGASPTFTPIPQRDIQHDQPNQFHTGGQSLGGTFDDAIGFSFFDPQNDLDSVIDFADINLDWQLLNEEIMQSHDT